MSSLLVDVRSETVKPREWLDMVREGGFHLHSLLNRSDLFPHFASLTDDHRSVGVWPVPQGEEIPTDCLGQRMFRQGWGIGNEYHLLSWCLELRKQGCSYNRLACLGRVFVEYAGGLIPTEALPDAPPKLKRVLCADGGGGCAPFLRLIPYLQVFGSALQIIGVRHTRCRKRRQ